MHRLLMVVGRAARGLAAGVGALARLNVALAAKVARLPALNLRVIGKVAANQVRFTGLQAAPLVATVAALVGGVSILQAVSLLTGLADDLIGNILVVVIVRELGPLVVAVILIGRSGTAMATELGAMRLNGELEALKAFRVEALDFVILPRVLGMVVSLFCLVGLFDVMGLLGGFAFSALVQDVSFALLRGRVAAALTNGDLIVSAAKAVLFGHAIALLSCYHGLRVRRSPTELPQAVTRAVVSSLVSVVAIDSAIAAAFYRL